jgi:hypothetical protein
MVYNGVFVAEFSWKLKAGVEYLWCWLWSEHFHNDEPRRDNKFSVSELLILRQTIFKRCSRLFAYCYAGALFHRACSARLARQ